MLYLEQRDLFEKKKLEVQKFIVLINKIYFEKYFFRIGFVTKKDSLLIGNQTLFYVLLYN